MIKSALIEAKKLLEFYIESTDDLDTEQTESVKHFIKALRAGCGCDDYNGFDCGCGKRAFLCDEALKELEGSLLQQKRKHIKQYVKQWMDGHEPDTFVKNEHGVVIYSAGHSSLNLVAFFENLLEDYLDKNGQ